MRGRQADAGRLRGAIGNVINDTKFSTRELDSQLRNALKGKIRSTEKLTNELVRVVASHHYRLLHPLIGCCCITPGCHSIGYMNHEPYWLSLSSIEPYDAL